MNRKYDYGFVKSYFFENGYELLSSSYENPHVKLDYRCPNGHLGQVRWYSFKSGTRCPRCYGNNKLSFDQVAKLFVDSNCVLLETDFKGKNSQSTLAYKCECGREAVISWDCLRKGQRCNGCRPTRQSGVGSGRYNPDRNAISLRLKLADACHTALKSTLKYLGKKKTAKSAKMLGYTVEELRVWLESHPNWHLVKNEKWSFDHIFPIKAFVDYGLNDVRLINSLDNLQPILLSDNLRKGSTYDKVKFVKWLNGKNICLSTK
jgi:hypothetical protein